MEEKKERNEEIYRKKKAGATYRQLSIDYNLSINTLLNIINRYKAKEATA